MSEHPQAGAPDERAGIVFAAAAYTAWGVLPIYWHALAAVSPFQITASRVLFAVFFVSLVTLARGRWSRILSILTTPKIARNLALTAGLIAVNWTVYVYAAASNQLVEASLGYYILPLLSIALGVTLFGERMSRLRLLGVVLAGIAVTVQTLAVGRLPWIALALAFSFGFYGYFRKLTPVDALDGLFIETLVLFPLVLGLFVYWAAQGTLAFQHESLLHDAMLVGAGPVTAIPLTMFAAGARRIRLSTLGFLQYLAPSITLLVATLLYGEPFKLVDGITFFCVWSALALVAAEGQMSRWRLRALRGDRR